MVSTETDLKDDVREFTGYTTTKVLSDNGLDTSYRKAKEHIRVEKSLAAGYEWYDTDFPQRQKALFWWTCLFTKVQTGELDSQNLQIGALDKDSLLAKEDDEVTMWYRMAEGAMNSINATSIFQSASPSRSDREYTAPTFNRDGTSGSGSDFDI